MTKFLKLLWHVHELVQIPRNVVWQLWVGLPIDISWRLAGLPLVYRAGGHNPFTRFVFGRLHRTSTMRIGHGLKALSTSKYNSIGVIQKVLLRTCSYGAELIIGNDVGLSGCSICASRSVRIGNRVTIGTGVVIADSDFHSVDPDVRQQPGDGGLSAPVVIEDDVFIGARAFVLKGVTIGRGSVVGACAVVTRSVPPYSVVAGNPARVIRKMRG